MLTGLDPKIRAAVYWGWFVLSLVAASAVAVFALVGIPPAWLGPVAEWLLLVGVAFGFIADRNAVIRVDETAFPVTARKIAYKVFQALSLVVFLASEFFRLANGGDPAWLDAFNAVLLIIGPALGLTAASHVAPSPPPADESQPEADLPANNRKPQGW
jgi:hypothetical protein